MTQNIVKMMTIWQAIQRNIITWNIALLAYGLILALNAAERYENDKILLGYSTHHIPWKI
jgi:hypothetical protein